MLERRLSKRSFTMLAFQACRAGSMHMQSGWVVCWTAWRHISNCLMYSMWLYVSRTLCVRQMLCHGRTDPARRLPTFHMHGALMAGKPGRPELDEFAFLKGLFPDTLLLFSYCHFSCFVAYLTSIVLHRPLEAASAQVPDKNK